MSQVLKFVPAVEVPHPGAGAGPARRLLRVALLRAAERAAQLAARLEAADGSAREQAAEVAPVRPWVPAGAAASRWVEAVVVAAVAVYFVIGLIGVFVL